MTLALLALVVITGCVAQAVSGIGFGLICGPVLVAALGQVDGVRTSVLLSAIVNAVVLVRHRQDAAYRSALALLVPAAIATPFFAIAVKHSPARVDEAIAGVAAIVGAAVVGSGARWRAASGRRGAVGAAMISAAGNTVAGIGGPPVALWADNAGWSHAKTRGTLQVYFLGLNTIALLSLGPPRHHLDRLGLGLCALAVGLALGHLVAGQVSEAQGRRTTLGLAFAGGVAVLVKALAG